MPRFLKKRSWRDFSDRGASAVEYGLIVVAIAAIVVAVVVVIGGRVKTTYSETCSNWNSAAVQSDACG